MNILIINHYAGSPELGMEYRPHYLAQALITKGHSVTIAASTFSHVRRKQPEHFSNVTTVDVEGVPFLWVPGVQYKGNGIRRFLSMLTFTGRLFQNARKISSLMDIDIVVASSTYPLDIIAARRIASLSSARLAFEIHDLWPLSPIELGGMPKWHPFILLMQWAENFAYRKSDSVVSILPGTKEHTVEHGLEPDKWHYIPNGIWVESDGEDAPLSQDMVSFIDKKKAAGVFLLGYTGSLGLANSLDTLIRAAGLLKESPVEFVIVGKGPELERLKSLRDALGISSVHFFSPITKSQVKTLLQKLDMAFLGLKKEPLFRFGISPNKLFDYMHAGTPVVFACDASNDLVSESGCGVVVEPENPLAIVKAIQQLIDLPVARRIAMGKKGTDYVIENHDYQKIAERFLDAIGS